jgi:hypothetical protein
MRGYGSAVPRTLHAAAAAAALAAAAGARAAEDPVLPPTVANLTGPRSASLGASLGLAGGNEGIFLNAASLAARPRYSIETHYLVERAGSRNAAQYLSGSVVDSQMGAWTAGFAYTRVAGGPSIGNAMHVALATRLSSAVLAGVTGKYLRLDGAEDVNAATVDASLFVGLGQRVSVGVTGFNLVDVNHPQQAPLGLGAGVAIGDDRSFHLTGDWRGDWDRRDELTHSWGAGLEYLAGTYFPLRGGYVRDGTREVDWWTAGVGLVSTSGLALDVAYRQSLDDPSDRLIGVAVKLFLLTN